MTLQCKWRENRQAEAQASWILSAEMPLSAAWPVSVVNQGLLR